MIAKLLDEIAANPPAEITALIELLGIAAQDQLYRGLLNQEAKALPNFEQRKAVLELGYFAPQDFLQLLHACGDGKGTKMAIITPLLNRLIDWGVVADHAALGSSVSYRWNKARIAMFIALRIADNILLGPAYVARKYRASVPAIYVQKGGNQHTGTGFLATSRAGAKESVIVTAKHNIDPAEGVSFIRLSQPEGTRYEPVAENWILHPQLDLALMPVKCDAPPAPIFPVGAPSVLARTITLGYPAIATTDASYLLAHGGELNAVVNTYFGEERLIISNVVAPGNSGGPVLDEAGLCLGMVVNSFETQHEGGVEKASSAIPAKHILDFIGPYCT